MKLYRLHIDGNEYFVRDSLDNLKKTMRLHIKAERAKGRSLNDIEFAWAPVDVTNLQTVMED